jgi:hypothetical protein
MNTEHVKDKLSRKERHLQLVQVLKLGEMPKENGKQSYNMSPLFTFIGDMMKQAYIAGANRLTHHTQFEDTGEILVEATNFAKDKGILT